jgi:hypothetical protein
MQAEAIRLRVEERKSLPEIQTLVPVSKGTLSLWLRGHPLTTEEVSTRLSRAAQVENTRRSAERIARAKPNSKFFEMAGPNLTSEQKGRIAEAAVLLRLVLNGFTPLRPVFEGHRTDWFVETPKGPVRLQVKWAWQGPHGRPIVSLRSSRRVGYSLYTEKDFDILVGYDLRTDEAHVFSWSDIKRLMSVSVKDETCEAWHKLTQGKNGV